MIVDQFPHEEIGYINMKKLKTLCPFYEALIRAQRVSYDIKVNSEFRRMFLSDLYFEGNAMLRKVLSGKSKNMTLSDKFVSGQGAIFSKKKKAEDNIKAISSETLVVPTLSRKLSVSVAAYEYIPIKSKYEKKLFLLQFSLSFLNSMIDPLQRIYFFLKILFLAMQLQE